MDSANSASLQSSSGGDDQEYDSRLTDNSFSYIGTSITQSTMFDPFANYFNPMTRQPSNALFDMDFSKSSIRSDLISQQINPMSCNNSFIFGQSPNMGVSNLPASTAATTPPAAVTELPARNPKKRSRASRRAPTTVLTTDTTNFRAMVQEFTGIPSAPFTSSSYFPGSRFNTFPTPNIRSANNIPLNISQPPPYLRRPFPQKIQPPFLPPPPPSSSSSLLSCLAANNNTASNSDQLSVLKPQPSSGVTNSDIFTTTQQNSILTSLLQSSQKYPLGVDILGTKEQQPFQVSHVLEEYGMSSSQHGHLMNSAISGLPNLISPEQESSSTNNNNSMQAQKVQETSTTMPSRGEGMMESWICSSD